MADLGFVRPARARPGSAPAPRGGRRRHRPAPRRPHHDAIDDLEARQRNECGEGDWRSVGRIAMRYDRIEGWINNEARQGGGWRGW
jgi:hypothetical protein